MQTLFWISFGILWVIVVIQGFALLEVLRQIGFLRKQQSAQQQGNLFVRNPALTGQLLPKAPGRRAVDLLPANWNDFLRGERSVLILLSTTCVACRTVAEKLHAFLEKARGIFDIAVVVEGDVEDSQAFIKSTGLDARLVILDEKGATADALGVRWKPGVVVVQDWQVDQVGIISDADQLDLLLAEAQRAERERQGVN
jgi:thiol-disulfide isomerase/thioredoxin